MGEDETIIGQYLDVFGREINPPSRLCEGVGETLLRYGRENNYAILRNPPYLEELKPFLDTYLLKIRALQKLTREKVVGLDLMLTEAEGADPNHLFDTNRRSVYAEFQNWGINDQEKARFINTGHLWVSVRRARFSTQNHSAASGAFEALNSLKNEIIARHAPVRLFYSYLNLCTDYRYSHVVAIMTGGNTELSDLENKEHERLDHIKALFDADAYFVMKGILSPSFVNSLAYRLEESLDLFKSHPGE